MRMIAASVLAFEAIVVLLAIPVAVTLGGVEPALAVSGGVALAVACVLVAGALGRPWGYRAGWIVQGLILASGLVVTSMFLVGGIFVALWAIGLRVGRRGEELRAERWAGVEDPKAAPPGTAG